MPATARHQHPQIGDFDGIVCIGAEDWWYHNRGHFDFQVMRRLAKRWPVLFVNSLGVRMPSIRHDRHFAGRISRKLKSFARGLVNVESRFWVYSPVTAPGAIGETVSAWALAPQIRMAARRAGITRPLLWVVCPPGAELIGKLGETAVVLQRTDRFEAFPEANPEVIGAQMATLKQRADLVVYAAPHLEAEERASVRRTLLVTHGVDFEMFAEAGLADGEEPDDASLLQRPRVGFIGGIDAHTFDPPLFLETARRLPDYTFMMVGACSLPEDWCTLPNVAFLGRKPYDEVARYMAAADVLIMPWNTSEWIKACNPIKLKEYLATGRPIVSTDFRALDAWRDLVRVADGPEAFAREIRAALSEPYDAATARTRVARESWDAKTDLIAEALVSLARGRGIDRRGSGAAQIRPQELAAAY